MLHLSTTRTHHASRRGFFRVCAGAAPVPARSTPRGRCGRFRQRRANSEARVRGTALHQHQPTNQPHNLTPNTQALFINLYYYYTLSTITTTLSLPYLLTCLLLYLPAYYPYPLPLPYLPCARCPCSASCVRRACWCVSCVPRSLPASPVLPLPRPTFAPAA